MNTTLQLLALFLVAGGFLTALMGLMLSFWAPARVPSIMVGAVLTVLFGVGVFFVGL